MVNVAARLEQRAQPGEIVIGEATYRLVRDAITVEELEPLELKGKSRAGRPRTASSTSRRMRPGLARRLESPIVGRSLELAELLEAFDETLESRSSRVATVLGEAGAGKSRLVQELATVVGERAAVLEGRCVPYGEGITYFPLAIMLKPLAGIEDEDTRDAARRKLLALLPDAEESSLVVARLAGAIGLDDVLARPEEIAWAVRRLLESLAQERPMLVVFDDLHWAELTFLRLVQYLGEHCRDAPILVVCCSRPELTEIVPGALRAPRHAARSSSSRLPTGRLRDPDREPARRRRLAGDRSARRGGRRRATRSSSRRRCACCSTRGLIARDGERWKPARDLADVVLPPSIEAVLAARLDRLEPAELAVVQRGAVIGRIFSWAAVRAISPEEEQAAVAGALEALLRKEVVFRDAQALSGGGGVPLRAHPRARRGIQGAAQGEASRAARARGDLSRGVHGRPRRRVRGDHRLPPRAGLRLPDRARAGERGGCGAARARPRPARLGRAIVRCFAATSRRRSTSSAGQRRSPQASADKAELLTRISGVLVQLGQFAEADALLEQALDAGARGRGRAP